MTAQRALETLLAHLGAPLVLVDVGARWGAPKQWEALADHAKIVCFEPDGEEAARLNALAQSNEIYLPLALGAYDQSTGTLHITQQPACTSIYSPIKVLYEHYAALAEIRPVRIVNTPIRSLDSVLKERGITEIDSVKLDTQGSELDILLGARDALRTCALIDVEVEFNPIYEGQNLFCDVDRFLRDQGFVLWRISDIAHYALSEDRAAPLNFRMSFNPPQEIHNLPVRGGQIFWAQAQYVRAEYPRTGLPQLPKESAVRAAAVMACAGFWDLAMEILSKSDGALAAEIGDLTL